MSIVGGSAHIMGLLLVATYVLSKIKDVMGKGKAWKDACHKLFQSVVSTRGLHLLLYWSVVYIFQAHGVRYVCFSGVYIFHVLPPDWGGG